MNFNFVYQNTYTNVTEIMLFPTTIALMQYLKNNNFSEADIGYKLILPSGRVVFFFLDTSGDYASFKEVANTIMNIGEDICVNFCHIGCITSKMVLLNFMAFHGHAKSIDVFVRDKREYRGLIEDAIHQILCCNIARQIRNEDSNRQISQRIKTLFRGGGASTSLLKCSNSNQIIRIDLIKNTDYPTIFLLGNVVNFETSKVWFNTGSATICGIMKYFSHYAHRFHANFIASLQIVNNDIEQDIEIDYIDAIIKSINCKPLLVLYFTEEVDHIELDANIAAVIQSSNKHLVNRTYNIGKMFGEKLYKNNITNQIYPNPIPGNFIKFSYPYNNPSFTGNGILSSINLVKKYLKMKNKSRNKK